MPQEVWDLISACWQQDPIPRPHITEVVAAVLTELLEVEEQHRRRPGGQAAAAGRQAALSGAHC